MKKLLLLLLLSLGLIGCSSLDSIEFSASPAEAETKKILALGLTHAENLSEARKLTDPTLVSEVVQELKTRNDNVRIEAEKVAKYAEKVKVSDSNSKFIGSEISNSKMRGVLSSYDFQDYFLQGSINNGLIQHQLHLSIKYTSNNWRNYYSASFSKENQVDITLISSSAVSCSGSSCDYTEVMELNLSDDFLRSNMETGFSIGFNSKKVTNNITIPSDYIKGYLTVAK
jgi:biopolymer transport protein ExbD